MAPLVEMLVSALVIYGGALVGTVMVLAAVAWAQLKSPDKSIFTTRRRDAPPPCLLDKELGEHSFATVKVGQSPIITIF